MHRHTQGHEALKGRLMKLSFDPYILSEQDLSWIETRVAQLSGAKQDGTLDRMISELCTTLEAEIRSDTDKLRALLHRHNTLVSDAWEPLLALLDRFKELSVFLEAATSLFSDVPEETRKELGRDAVAILNRTEGVRNAIAVSETTPKPVDRSAEFRRRILLLRLSVELSADPRCFAGWADLFEKSLSQLGQYHCIEKELHELVLAIAAELIPPFESTVRASLAFSADGFPVPKESEIYTLYRELLLFRERLKQAFEHLLHISHREVL